MNIVRRAVAGLFILLASSVPMAAADPQEKVWLEDLTSPEVAARLNQGWTTIIIPSGGTEQNGPHLTLGKHNIVVGFTAGEIARRLGRTLVAPVIAYVPEGEIDPPQGHMRYPGTISLPEPIFAALLDAAARSFIATGFRTILFIGDSGGNQVAQVEIARRLDAEFGKSGIRVLAVGDYYAANGQVDWLKEQGEDEAAIGTHAGIREASELLAIDPGAVRSEKLAPGTDWTGASGRPDRADAARGRALLDLKIDAALRQIRRVAPSSP
jgi:creatinine amidohydrolase